MSPRLEPHPRLWATAAQLQRVREPSTLPLLRRANRRLARLAASFLGGTDFKYPGDRHNAHLIRARIAQQRVVTLLVRYRQTGNGAYRAAALEHVRAIGNWPYWSWITWRQGNADPNAIFDLSYGENSLTLAVAYDWLHDELTAAERAELVGIARRRSLVPFLRHTGRHGAMWWYRFPLSNWNSVCSGGAGLLALAVHEEAPEAVTVLRRAESSIAAYMRSLRASHGAWPEGIGYWNYGMRYAFLYLLGHENATGRAHPLLRQAATRATLRFPLDFCPNGVPASFGDVNAWRPIPFHYAAAHRLGARDVLGALAAQPAPATERETYWPHDAELVLLHPRTKPSSPRPRSPVATCYRGQDWAILADRLPRPRLYVAIRGGTTDVPHGHRDLLSFHAVAGAASFITSLGIIEYLDSTFGPRRAELFEAGPASKNTILINGIGIADKSSVRTTRVRLGAMPGFRLDATAAMGRMRDGPVAQFCGRLFLLLPGPAVLILDRVELPHPGRVETRLHTLAGVRTAAGGVTLRRNRETFQVRWAGDVPAAWHRAVDAPTTPTEKAATLLRWCTDQLHARVTLATLLVPGDVACGVRVETNDQAIRVRVRLGGRTQRLRLTTRLRG